MIDTNALYRPGLAAIAAVLALSSTSAMAQVALPSIAPAEPATAAPAAPVMAAPAAPVQTVQSVPVTPTLPELAVPAEQPQSRAPRAAAPVQRTARAETRTAETPRATPSVPTPVPVMERASAPAPAREAAPALTAAPVETAPAQPEARATTADTTNYANWILLGGGLLLIGGGTAFALSRRPKRRAQADGYVMAQDDATVVTAAPVVMPERAVARPVHDPVPQRAAAMAMAQQSVPQSRDYVAAAPDGQRSTLETMVAEAPSQANPFLSRRNRLRRANFLLRTGQADPRQGEYNVTDDRQPEAAASADRWSEMRFRGREKTRVSWKPVTNR